MFKWLTGIWQIVEELSRTAKTVFVFTVVMLTAGYFFMDRIFEHQEAVNYSNKREWHKPKTPEGMTYMQLQEEQRHYTDQKVNKAN